MQTIEWKSELNTGIDNVDKDHRYLIKLTNQLINAIEADISKENILKIFDELESYTVYHFDREESYMEEHAHSKESHKYIKHHKAQHQYFIEQLSKLRTSLVDSTQKSVSYDVVEFLLHWLLDHIIKEDLRIKQFIQSDTKEQKKEHFFKRIDLFIRQHTTLKQRFMIIFAVPLIFLVLQSAFVSHKAYHRYVEYGQAQELTKSILYINDTITQLQKERGLSSAYIISGYRHFENKLREQRHKTTESIYRNTAYQTVVSQYIDLTEPKRLLHMLDSIRKKIDEKQLTKKQSIAYYTSFINTLIDVIKDISYLPFNTLNKHTYGALVLLMRLNEVHGLIRNEGVSCLERKKKDCEHLLHLYHKKEIYEEALYSIASNDMIKALDTLRASSCAQEIVQMKKTLLENRFSGHKAAQQWFKKTSEWIGSYNTIITRYLKQINHSAILKKEEFATMIQHIWILFSLMLIFIIISIYLLQKSIIRPIESLTKALHRLSSGDKSIFFTTITHKDAISKMEQAYNKLRNSLIKADYASLLTYLQEMKTQKYAKLSEEDALTGIYNRRAFMQMLQKKMHESEKVQRPLSLLILDIDHFKKINDTYGHDIGDLILQNFSHTIKQNIRKNDVFARIGGEEFALLLPYTDLQDACRVAKNLVKAVSLLEIKDIKPTLTMTVSIGVSSYEKGMSEKELMQLADRKLYKAKHSGRNQASC